MGGKETKTTHSGKKKIRTDVGEKKQLRGGRMT